MTEIQKLKQISLGLKHQTVDVTYTQITVTICGQYVKLECAHIHHEDITDEIILHLLKQRIAGIQKYKDINKIDLYERDKCAHWVLGRFLSIDIPEKFKDRFTDGEMIDDPDAIETIMIDFITEHNGVLK